MRFNINLRLLDYLFDKNRNNRTRIVLLFATQVIPSTSGNPICTGRFACHAVLVPGRVHCE